MMYILEVLCALAVAVPCANVEALVTKDVDITGPVVEFATKELEVDCGDSNCKLEKLTGSAGSGALYATISYGGYGYYCFGSDEPYAKSCRKGNIGHKSFHINVIPKGSFANARISMTMGNSFQITVLSTQGSKIKYNAANQKYVQIKSGDRRKSFPYYTQVEVTCTGVCEDVEISLINGQGNANLAASEGEPALIRKNGCYNCFCTSNDAGNTDECKDGSNKIFNLNSNVAYIALLPDPSFTNVEAIVKAKNIESIRDRFNLKKRETILSDGTYVQPIPPNLKTGESATFEVYCDKFYRSCTNTTIGVVGNANVTIRAGQATSKDDQGNCRSCFCNGSACLGNLNPGLVSFDVAVEALENLDDISYVTIKDTDVRVFSAY